VLLALLAPSCRTPNGGGSHAEPWDRAGDPAAIPGIPRLERPAWHNFYERGMALAMQKRWALAARDFLTATGDVPGAAYGEPRDRRHARTYGMRFLDDYFPHREAGVSFYYLGDYARAARELQTSLAMFPTSRASVYLDQVREAMLKRSGVRPDPAGIRFAIAGPPDGGYINTTRFHLKGTVSSRNWIADVNVNGLRLFIEQAQQTYPLESTLALQPGPQTLALAATDLAGGAGVWERHFTVDLRSPVITIGLVAGAGGAAAEVKVSDDYELARVLVGSLEVPRGPDPRRATVRLPLPLRDEIVVAAVDGAGNRASLRASPESLAKAEPHRDAGPAVRQLAWAGGATVPRALLAAARPGLRAAPPDTDPPSFSLSPPIQDRAVVTTEEYCLDLKVSDRAGIRRISVRLNDGEPRVQEFGESCCTSVSFVDILRLRQSRDGSQPAENLLVLAAEDCGGRTREQRIAIMQKPGHEEDCRLRMQTGLLPFKAMAGTPLAGIAVHLDRDFLAALRTHRKPRLGIVVHDAEVLARIAQELQISQSSLAARGNRGMPLRTGQIRPAEWLLRGELFERPGGAECNWEVLLEVIDIESGMGVAQVDMHFEGFAEADREHRLGGLVSKLYQVLPLAAAQVTSVGGRTCRVPLGRQDGVREYMRFFFVPAEGAERDAADPITITPDAVAASAEDTGAPPQNAGTILVEGVVTSVKENECKLEIRPAAAASRIPKGARAALR
jgi:hypothetical protein